MANLIPLARYVSSPPGWGSDDDWGSECRAHGWWMAIAVSDLTRADPTVVSAPGYSFHSQILGSYGQLNSVKYAMVPSNWNEAPRTH